MKEVIYKFGIRQKPALRALAEKATEVLEEIMGNNASEVSAEWDIGTNARNQNVLTLTLSDWTGSATRVIEPEQLQSSSWRELPLLRVWGDLLRIRNHKQLQELLSSETNQEGG
jgi:hypothetical protein